MSIVKHRTGEVRTVWRVTIAVLAYVAVALLLRFIPIFVRTTFQASRGINRQDALAAAKTLVFEHPIWSTAIGIVNGLMSLVLVWLLIRVIEKRAFAWEDVGLDWRRNSLPSVAFGALLALLMYVAGTAVGRVFGSSLPTAQTLLADVTVSAVVRNIALYVPMGFGEEVLFRGYVQARLVERHGVFRGILIGSIVFTVLHLLGRPLSPVTLLSGVILWAAVGTLYYWSQSLYLVGMFHAVMNTLLNVLPSDWPDAAGLIVHVLALALIALIGLHKSRLSPAPRNRAGAAHGQ